MKTISLWLSTFFFLASVTTCGQVNAAPQVRAAVDLQDTLSVEDILRYASQLDFSDPQLIASIAKIESDYQPKATNRYNGVTYYGLMQISYNTAKMVGFKGDPKELMNWRTNVKWASKYLELLLAQHGSTKKAIAAYNAGSVFYCQKKCPRGQLVNQLYVSQVMATYQGLKEIEVPGKA